jgi:hypothetical protein
MIFLIGTQVVTNVDIKHEGNIVKRGAVGIVAGVRSCINDLSQDSIFVNLSDGRLIECKPREIQKTLCNPECHSHSLSPGGSKMKYQVLVTRTETSSALVEVETDSTDEDTIRNLAVEYADDGEFSGDETSYEAFEIEKIKEKKGKK